MKKGEWRKESQERKQKDKERKVGKREEGKQMKKVQIDQGKKVCVKRKAKEREEQPLIYKNLRSRLATFN